MLRYASERDKTNQILNLTSLTVEQFEQKASHAPHVPIRPMPTRRCPHPKTACCSCCAI